MKKKTFFGYQNTRKLSKNFEKFVLPDISNKFSAWLLNFKNVLIAQVVVKKNGFALYCCGLLKTRFSTLILLFKHAKWLKL